MIRNNYKQNKRDLPSKTSIVSTSNFSYSMVYKTC